MHDIPCSSVLCNWESHRVVLLWWSYLRINSDHIIGTYGVHAYGLSTLFIFYYQNYHIYHWFLWDCFLFKWLLYICLIFLLNLWAFIVSFCAIYYAIISWTTSDDNYMLSITHVYSRYIMHMCTDTWLRCIKTSAHTSRDILDPVLWENESDENNAHNNWRNWAGVKDDQWV